MLHVYHVQLFNEISMLYKGELFCESICNYLSCWSPFNCNSFGLYLLPKLALVYIYMLKAGD